MKNQESRNHMIGGLALILFGLVALAAQFFDLGEILGLLILPGLGAIFLAWGLLTRQSGLLIPGGILSGVGAGVLLINGPFQNVNDDAQGGIFMISFALGWFLIPILSTIFTRDNHWWAVIPGGIMALIGGGLLFGGMALTILEFLGQIWPIFLILIGVYLLLHRSTGKKTV